MNGNDKFNILLDIETNYMKNWLEIMNKLILFSLTKMFAKLLQTSKKYTKRVLKRVGGLNVNVKALSGLIPSFGRFVIFYFLFSDELTNIIMLTYKVFFIYSILKSSY